MSSVFAKPLTMGQWLLGSACWLGSSLGSWLALVVASSTFLPRGHTSHEFERLLTISGLLVVHGLIWRKVVFRWQPAQDTDSIGLFLVAGFWLFVLVLFQLACLVGILFGLLFGLAAALNGFSDWSF